MSAAAIAAMAAIQAEEARRRNDPNYEPFMTVGALIDCDWAGPVLLLIAVVFCAAMLYITFS